MRMLKIFKAQFIMILAAIFLVSMGDVFANDDTIKSGEEIIEVKENNKEERWRFQIGRNSIRYGTKYTFIVNGESYEYYLKYKEVVPQNKQVEEAKFIGHYWGMQEEDKNKDENYIYSKDKIEITRKDVIEFLEIEDEKLAAIIKSGCEVSLFIEPYYSYQKEKCGEVYISTARELYIMLPESTGIIPPYANAKNENGKIVKSNIQGIEVFREMIVKAMKEITGENSKKFEEFKNAYNEKIKTKMLNKGWTGYYFEEQIKTGEFIKMVSEALWPNHVYKEPKEGDHWATPYAYTLNHSVLYAPSYNYEKFESLITRAEAAEILCRFYLVLNNDKSIEQDEKYIKKCKDELKIEDANERYYINGAIQFGLLNNYSDGTFRPDETLTKQVVNRALYKALYTK